MKKRFIVALAITSMLAVSMVGPVLAADVNDLSVEEDAIEMSVDEDVLDFDDLEIEVEEVEAEEDDVVEEKVKAESSEVEVQPMSTTLPSSITTARQSTNSVTGTVSISGTKKFAISLSNASSAASYIAMSDTTIKLCSGSYSGTEITPTLKNYNGDKEWKLTSGTYYVTITVRNLNSGQSVVNINTSETNFEASAVKKVSVTPKYNGKTNPTLDIDGSVYVAEDDKAYSSDKMYVLIEDKATSTIYRSADTIYRSDLACNYTKDFSVEFTGTDYFKLQYNKSYVVWLASARDIGKFETEKGVSTLKGCQMATFNSYKMLKGASTQFTTMKAVVPQVSITGTAGAESAGVTMKLDRSATNCVKVVTGYELYRDGSLYRTENLSDTTAETINISDKIEYLSTVNYKVRVFFKQADGQTFYSNMSNEISVTSQEISLKKPSLTGTKISANRVQLFGTVNDLDVTYVEFQVKSGSSWKTIKRLPSKGSYATYTYKYSKTKAASKTYRFRSFYETPGGKTIKSPASSSKKITTANVWTKSSNGKYDPNYYGDYAHAYFLPTRIAYKSSTKITVTGYVYNHRIFKLKKGSKVSIKIYSNGTKIASSTVKLPSSVGDYAKKKFTFTIKAKKGYELKRLGGYSTHVEGKW